jgi:hypothetical protein
MKFVEPASGSWIRIVLGPALNEQNAPSEESFAESGAELGAVGLWFDGRWQLSWNGREVTRGAREDQHFPRIELFKDIRRV